MRRLSFLLPGLVPILLPAPMLLLAPVPVQAQQQSDSYKFLEAVRAAKGNEVIAMVDRPGSNLVNTRDTTSGESALHIVVKRGDIPYTNYFLAKGADANARDARGNTPLILAVNAGSAELVPILVNAKANPNLGNSSGETPLIRAVQRRDLTLVRALLSAGADADQPDIIAGKSARDYTTEDARNPAIAKLLAETPKKVRRAVAGPKL